ncbi:MAG TPA: T9SS type A sorting domain-containing protein [Lentimicrobium sp.]|nr:T9SS type A sorting domain-containing protein [Lentimicrobium sp.]
MKKITNLLMLFSLVLLFWQSGAQIPEPLKVKGSAKKRVTVNTPVGLNYTTRSSRYTGLLFDNGDIINSPGTGAEGADESFVYPPISVLAYPSATPCRTADDFSITDYAWDIDSLVFFDAILQAPTYPSAYTAYYIRIWDGKPGTNGSHVIWGDRTTNRLSNSVWSGAYRVGEHGSTSLPIFRNTCSTDNLTLLAGHYWVEVQVYSSEIDYTWMAPVVSETPTSGNAIWLNELENVWQPWESNGYPQGMPFQVYGSTVRKNTDVGIVSLVSPASASGLGNNENITVTIKNFGTQPVSNVQVSYMLNNGTPLTQFVPATISPEQEVDFTFTVPADFSQQGEHKLLITSILPGDEYSANDQKEFKIFNYQQIVNMSTTVVAACSGVFFDSGGPDANYAANEENVITFFPASSAQNVKMEFNFIDFESEYVWDSLYVYNGPTWQYHPLLTVLNGGDTSVLNTIRSTDPSGALTFRFVSDPDFEFRGWKAEFKCHVPMDSDLAAISINGPVNATTGRPVVYTVKVKNEGNLTNTGYTIALVDGNGTVIGSTTGTTINYNEEIEYSILGTFTTAGLNDLHAEVIFSGDQDASNNSTYEIEVETTVENATYIIVGDQNNMDNRLPVSYESMNSLTECIYFADEIGMEGIITGTGFIYSFREDVSDVPLMIWIGETGLENLSADWVPSTELTLVYDGSVSYVKGIDTLKIDFDIPYEYHGQNLIMMVYRPLDYTIYPGTNIGKNIFQISETPNHPYRSREFFADIMIANPSRPRFGYLVDMIPNTLFKFDVSMMAQLEGNVSSDSGAPLQNANVSVEESHTQATTTTGGDYAINYIWPGAKIAKAEKFTYNDASVSIDFGTGSSLTHDFILTDRQKSFVSGSIRPSDAPWNGLADVEILLEGYDTTYTTVTNGTGMFLIPGVWNNTTYTFTAIHAGYENYTTEITTGADNYDMGTIIMNEQTAYPQNIVAVDNEAVANITWDAATLEYTIQYDNDSVYYYLTSFSDARESAIRFTPQSYPCQVKRAILNVHDAGLGQGYPPSSFDVKVYDDDGNDGRPGTLLGQVTATPGGDGWFEVDLSSFDIMITSGDFYIAHVQTSSMPQYVEIGLDQSEHPENRSWSKPASWSTWELEQYYYHFMIRAVVSGSTSDEITLNSDDNQTTDQGNCNRGTESMTGYSVYRLLAGQQEDPSSWITLAGDEAITDYTDTQWNSLPFGEYLYAVRTNYDNGVISSPGFSNVLERNMYVTANIELATNTDYRPLDPHIVLTNIDDPSTTYTIDTAYAGIATISPFKRGTYRLQVWHHNFYPFDEVLDMTTPGNMQILLTEIIFKPEWATALDNDTVALVDWYDPEMMRDIILDDSLSDAGLTAVEGSEIRYGNLFTNRYPGNVMTGLNVYFERHPFAEQEEAIMEIYDTDHNLLGISESFVPEYDKWNMIRVHDIVLPEQFYAMVHFTQVMSPSQYIAIDTDGPNTENTLGWVCSDGLWFQLDYYGINRGLFMIRPQIYLGDENTAIPSPRSTAGYSLYLLEAGQENEPELWNEINPSVAATEYSDESWYTQLQGSYRYAVRCNYSTGSSSDNSFTNLLVKPQTFPAPENLAVVQTGEETAQFTWSPFNRADLISYDVYLNDLTTPVATVTDTTYTFTGLLADVPYLAGVRNNFTIGSSGVSNLEFILIVSNTNLSTMKNPEIFPNPVHDVVFIAEAKGGLAELYNANGDLIMVRQLDEQVSRLNLESLSGGIYVMKIRLNNSITTQKLVITK